MSVKGFDLRTFGDDGSYCSRRVDLTTLIGEQRQAVGGILLKVTKALKKEREFHKARFRMKKLVQFFPPTLSYYCSKVSKGASGGDFAPAQPIS